MSVELTTDEPDQSLNDIYKSIIREPIPDELNRISGAIVAAALRVHRGLGPGLLESAYETCLAYEISKTGLNVNTQVTLPLKYSELTLDAGYRIDIIVEDVVIVEVKAAEKLLPIHEAQLLTYLKLSKLRLGLLIKFNVKLIKEGIVRLVR